MRVSGRSLLVMNGAPKCQMPDVVLQQCGGVAHIARSCLRKQMSNPAAACESPIPVRNNAAFPSPATTAAADFGDDVVDTAAGFPGGVRASRVAAHQHKTQSASSTARSITGKLPVDEINNDGQPEFSGNTSTIVNQILDDHKDLGGNATTKLPAGAGGAVATAPPESEEGRARSVENDPIRVGDATETATSSVADREPALMPDAESRGMIKLAEGALASLYETHDNFFSPNKGEKEGRLKSQAREVLDALARVGDRFAGIHERARLSYIRGRALDVFSEFDPAAEKSLARAVKLHPSNPDGWSALGHCYWKKPDLPAAERCFRASLDKERRPDTLRQLSMLLRQLTNTANGAAGEGRDHLQESLRLAKEAVTMGVGAGASWYVLGNAYVAYFFRSSRSIKDLDRALQAYKKAESNGERGNPDLFFNRAQVLHYREDYPEAIRDYRLAQQLDPMLPVEQVLHSIEAGVERRAKLVDRKGGLKAKRLLQLIAPLRAESVRQGLGEAARLVGLKELSLGMNKCVAMALKVIMPAGHSEQPPERFVVVDRSGECAILSLFSVSKEACERIQSGDTLFVKDPTFRTICLGGALPAPPPPSGQPTAASIGETAAVGEGGAARGVLYGAQAKRVGKNDDNGETYKGGQAGNSDYPAAAAPAAVPAESAGSSDSRSSGRKVAATRTGPSPSTGADSVPPTTTVSYPGVHADPGQVLVNGLTMKAGFAPPAIRLATFDK